MRKLFISADMEGCCAVASQNALAPDRWEWPAARRWMTEEVVTVSSAALAAGYDEVIVADGHGNAQNIDPESLPENVWLVRSWPRPLLQMQGIQEERVVACAFVGYHAGSVAQDSILAHTYSSAYRAVKLNGEHCSEGYLNAALAGQFGCPVVFVSGDQYTVQDALRYAPGGVKFTAKRSLGWRSQTSLPPRQTRRMLGEAAAGAFSRPLPNPFELKGPFHLELEMTSQVSAEMLAYLPSVTRTAAFSIAVRFDSVDQIMRFIAFGMHYSPTGVPPAYP